MFTFAKKLQKMFQLIILGILVASGGIGPVYAVEIVPAASSSLSVEHHKSRLIRLPRAATSVFIANPEIADVQVKSPTLIYLFGKTVGTTTLYAVDGKDRVIANMDVDVTHNLKNLQKAVFDIAPQADVNFSSINGALVMEGTLSSAREVEQIRQIAERFSPEENGLINRLSVDAYNQVNLRVRIAEVSREVNKNLGFDWTALGSIGGSFTFGVGMTNSLAQAATTVGQVAFNSSDISGVIDAMEEEGLITILSEPNLTAMSGQEASFLAGGEFPILYPEEDKTVFEFKEFGVKLDFKPIILDSGRINLNVAPEVSSLSESNSVSLGGFVIPAITTRRANTTVELASGQSFAIAGLLQNKTSQNLSKFPGLGDIPVLGALFRSDRFQREETELVIIVTPYVVKPIRHAKAVAPTDGFSAPHDVERVLFGDTIRRNPKVGAGLNVDAKGRKLIGPAGFVLN